MNSKFEGFDEEEEAFLRKITSIGTPSKKSNLKTKNESKKVSEVKKSTAKLNNRPTTQQRSFRSDEELLDFLERYRNPSTFPNDKLTVKEIDKQNIEKTLTQQEYSKKEGIGFQKETMQTHTKTHRKSVSTTETVQDKIRKKERNIKIAIASKKIQKNIFKQTRYTIPKKRNILSKMILQKRLKRGFYDDIEAEYDHIGQNKIDNAKNFNTKEGKRFYREVQDYEDAILDMETRNGWHAFKIGLATLMLATSLVVANKLPKNIDEFKNNTTQTEIDKSNKEQQDEEQIRYFKDNVKNYDGYEFDFLTDKELLDKKNKLAEIGNKLSKSTYEIVRTGSGDQEFLDSLAQKAYGNEYENLSDEQKRDYRQLAYEVLRVNCTSSFKPTETCIRNPIVWDVLQAKEQMKRKGYKTNFIINADQQEHIKTVGNIMHIENTIDLTEYQNASFVNQGQDLLDNIVKEATNENLSKTEIRDYKQISYELLPTEVKDVFIKDPIDVDKSLEGYEYGE